MTDAVAGSELCLYVTTHPLERTLFDNLYRRSILGIAGAAPVERLMRRVGFRFGVGRFVAGETLDEAMAVLERLDQNGLKSLLDLLGEFVDSRDGVTDMVNQVLITLDRLGQSEIEPYMSVKPTQLGLGLDYELALSNARAVARRAGQAGAHVCLDMENHPYTDRTLDMFRILRREGHDNVSTVLQSYLHRTLDDLRGIAAEFPDSAVRIVKGAYQESPDVAHQDTPTILRVYLQMVDIAFETGMHANIATHDERLISQVEERVKQHGLSPDRYEFQLLYGIKPRLQARLAAAGHAVRIYVPYGHDWYGYYSRRLAERPANLGMVIRGLFG